jgi:single-strand DNA-binding protein
MNKIQIIGNLTRDPEMKMTANNVKYARFTLAVNRSFGNETDFINCTAWDKKAELIEKYAKKGNKLGVSGRLEISKTEKDGTVTYHHAVIVEDFDFLTPKPTETAAPAPEVEKPDIKNPILLNPGELPF